MQLKCKDKLGNVFQLSSKNDGVMHAQSFIDLAEQIEHTYNLGCITITSNDFTEQQNISSPLNILNEANDVLIVAARHHRPSHELALIKQARTAIDALTIYLGTTEDKIDDNAVDSQIKTD